MDNCDDGVESFEVMCLLIILVFNGVVLYKVVYIFVFVDKEVSLISLIVVLNVYYLDVIVYELGL